MDDKKSFEQFKQSVLYRRYIYLRIIKRLGYQVDDEIAELEEVVHPGLKNSNSPGEEILDQRDIEELQISLWLSENTGEKARKEIKAEVIRLGNLSIRIYLEKKHGRPHFHVRYKTKYDGSYAIDTLEKLAGNLPRTLEKQVVEWATPRKAILRNTWNMMLAGKDINEWLIELKGSEE